MRKLLFVIAVAFLAQAAAAATVGDITITTNPPAPVPNQPFTLTVRGTWSDSCVPHYFNLSNSGAHLVIDAVANQTCSVCTTGTTPYSLTTTTTATAPTPGTYTVDYYVTECNTRRLEATKTVTVSSSSCAFDQSLSIDPPTVRPGELFVLRWCDPSFSNGPDNGYDVQFFRVLAARSLNGPYNVIGDVPDEKTAVQFGADAGDIGTTYFFVEAHGCNVTIAGCLGDSVLRTNVVQLTTVPQSACLPNDNTLCLNNARFQVRAKWTTPNGVSGNGEAVSLTGESGYFWFFTPDNVEVVVKALNACDSTTAPRFWVFAAGLTDVGVDLTVTDTKNGTTRVYKNPVGTKFTPIQDTNAFATCP
ncbi:MAG: hypothetical protein JOZ54_20190 [Acidobacteria bacterium]|nr:hypothetical protein [Acidobacteriota bacterium]